MQEINTWPGWECVRELGSGSFGKVYEIQKEEFGRTFRSALKVITVPQNKSDIQDVYSEGMDRQSAVEYFEGIVQNITEEFVLMADLKGHSNIVSYEDHMVIPHEGEIGWDILIRMELLTPFTAWMENRTLSEEEIIKLGCDICRALELCQKKRVIHRDIKPDNIFVSSYGDFKLGDFGIARTMERTVSNLSKKGTYNYMAPEVYLGRPYGATADIYSLGTVLYRFLNENRIPFLPTGAIKFTDREEALAKRMGGAPVMPPLHGSAQLKSVVTRALNYDPMGRYQSATDFLHALESCRAGSYQMAENTMNIFAPPPATPSNSFSPQSESMMELYGPQISGGSDVNYHNPPISPQYHSGYNQPNYHEKTIETVSEKKPMSHYIAWAVGGIVFTVIAFAVLGFIFGVIGAISAFSLIVIINSNISKGLKIILSIFPALLVLILLFFILVMLI